MERENEEYQNLKKENRRLLNALKLALTKLGENEKQVKEILEWKSKAEIAMKREEQLSEEFDAKKEENKTLKEQLKISNEEAIQLEKKLEMLLKSINESNTAIEERTRSLLRTMEEYQIKEQTIEELEARALRKEGELRHLRGQIEKLSMVVERGTHEREALEKRVKDKDKLEATVKTQRDELKIIKEKLRKPEGDEDRINRMENHCRSLEAQNQELQHEVAALQSKASRRNKKIYQLKSQIKEILQERDMLLSDFNKLGASKIGTAQDKKNETFSEARVCDVNLGNDLAYTKSGGTNQVLAQAIEELKYIKQEKEKLAHERNASNDLIRELREKIFLLEEQYTSEQRRHELSLKVKDEESEYIWQKYMNATEE